MICLGSLALTLPTIFNHIHDPNLITYFNADEGYLMDLIWSYFSGEMRGSYMGSIDYGLEMVYLSDLAKTVFPFIHFSPGSFVLILRLIHLLAWMGSLILLWVLVGRHFKKGWSQVVCVLLLSVNSAFAYFINNLKPEFLVLFFILLSLYFLLRLVEKPSYGSFILSIAFAAVAMVIKFSGIFLLPPIIAAVYISRKNSIGRDLFPIKKNAGVYLCLLCILFAFTPLLPVYFYVRKTSGLTYYEEFGLWQSILKFKFIFFIWTCLGGAVTFFLIPAFHSKKVKEFNSNAWTAIRVFILCFMIFGCRWFSIPRHLIETYSFHVLDFTGGTSLSISMNFSSLFHAFLAGIISRVFSCDFFIYVALIIYLWLEFQVYLKGALQDHPQFFKRLILLGFLVPFFFIMLTPGRITSHHLLPFFVVIFILVMEGVYIAKRRVIQGVLMTCLLITVVIHGTTTIKSRVHQFQQSDDIVFEFAKWWRENIPLDAKVVADHYLRVYIAPEYKNIKNLKGSLGNAERLIQLRQILSDERPQYVYYNRGASGSDPMPSLEEIIPDQKMRLVKVFDSDRHQYHRYEGDQIVVYELLY